MKPGIFIWILTFSSLFILEQSYGSQDLLFEAIEENNIVGVINLLSKDEKYDPYAFGGKHNDTLIGIAARLGRYDILDLLLYDKFPKVDEYVNKEGRTPLYLAMENKQKEVIQLLLQNGANPALGYKPKVIILPDEDSSDDENNKVENTDDENN